jgi:hypothetical protein
VSVATGTSSLCRPFHRRIGVPALLELHQDHEEMVRRHSRHLVELSKGLAEHRANRSAARAAIKTRLSRRLDVVRHDSARHVSYCQNSQPPGSFPMEGQVESGLSARVFVAIRGGAAIALGEFGQPQPHRCHFGKQSFILQRTR